VGYSTLGGGVAFGGVGRSSGAAAGARASPPPRLVSPERSGMSAG
jgi:hypothetical protein